jgi:hypothetical protein
MKIKKIIKVQRNKERKIHHKEGENRKEIENKKLKTLLKLLNRIQMF